MNRNTMKKNEKRMNYMDTSSDKKENCVQDDVEMAKKRIPQEKLNIFL